MTSGTAHVGKSQHRSWKGKYPKRALRSNTALSYASSFDLRNCTSISDLLVVLLTKRPAQSVPCGRPVQRHIMRKYHVGFDRHRQRLAAKRAMCVAATKASWAWGSFRFYVCPRMAAIWARCHEWAVHASPGLFPCMLCLSTKYSGEPKALPAFRAAYGVQ